MQSGAQGELCEATWDMRNSVVGVCPASPTSPLPPSLQVTRAQLMAQSDSELLDACGFLANRQLVTARDRRALTAAYYKQDKWVAAWRGRRGICSVQLLRVLLVASHVGPIVSCRPHSLCQEQATGANCNQRGQWVGLERCGVF